MPSYDADYRILAIYRNTGKRQQARYDRLIRELRDVFTSLKDEAPSQLFSHGS